MLLSIGLITKNEEKYLDECLAALMPITRAISSEIIVVDTGSDDATPDIARKYTDRVYHFDWCNDFAAARNETLRYAKGEWYLYFDADEILQNPDAIISFFTSGEYRKYQSASYIKRNFTMQDLSCYSDQNTTRMVRRTPDLQFEGVIHEQLTPVNIPTKSLDALFHHFGYLYETEEDKKAKAMRNVELLEKKAEQDHDPFTYLQLAESLRGIDPKRALAAALSGMQLVRMQTITMHLLCKIAASMYHILGDLHSAAEMVDTYFDLKNRYRFTDMEMYVLAGYILFDLQEYEMCVQYFEAYHNLYVEYHNGGSRSMTGYTVGSVSPFEYRAAGYTALSACFNAGADENACDWLDRMPLSQFDGSEQDFMLRVMMDEEFDNTFGGHRLADSFRQSPKPIQDAIVLSIRNKDTVQKLITDVYGN